MPSDLQREQTTSPPSPSELPPVSLSDLERRALHLGLPASDDPHLTHLDQLVVQSARALAGPHRAEIRLRMTAKALAAARAKVLIVESLLDARIAAADDRGVRRMSRVVEGARRHFVALLAEHRHACEGGRRTPVRIAVGTAESVNVMAVGDGR